MRVLAEPGAGAHQSDDIATILKVKTIRVAPTRSNFDKERDDLFAVTWRHRVHSPLFDQYMKRAIPKL
jgi:hypothetical protein